MPDEAAFDQFYADTAASVVAQVYVMVGDFAEAEDAVQEAYARAWQRWGRVGSYADPTGWVRTAPTGSR
jgi:RNA polymerase sigma-70 factor (ECF subfamily)